jgi:hypothetical protein
MKGKERGHATNKWSEDSCLQREFLALAMPTGCGGIKVLGHGRSYGADSISLLPQALHATYFAMVDLEPTEYLFELRKTSSTAQ